MHDWAQELVDLYKEKPLSDDTDEFDAVQTALPEPEHVTNRPQVRVPKTSPVVVALGGIVFIGLLAGAGLIVKGVAGASQDHTAVAAREESCDNEPMADLVTPEGVTVAFQRAYFHGETKQLAFTISGSSPMADQDFSDVVPAQPLEPCVHISTVTPQSVTAVTRIVDPKKAQVIIYNQEFTFENTETGPRIVTIKDEKGDN